MKKNIIEYLKHNRKYMRQDIVSLTNDNAPFFEMLTHFNKENENGFTPEQFFSTTSSTYIGYDIDKIIVPYLL